MIRIPTATAASSDVFAAPPASSGLAPAKAFVVTLLVALLVTETAPEVPAIVELFSSAALVVSSTMIFTAIPAPIPVPPSSSSSSAGSGSAAGAGVCKFVSISSKLC